METIKFKYTYEEDQPSTQNIDIIISCGEGLKVEEVCQSFFTFMTAIGYSEDSIIRCFKD